MKLDPSQILVVRRLEASFGHEYLGKALRAMPLLKQISYHFGSKAHADEIAGRALHMMMKDIEGGALCDRYAEAIVTTWQDHREKLVGGAHIEQADETQNLQRLKASFAEAQKNDDVVEMPEYMSMHYDPIRVMARR